MTTYTRAIRSGERRNRSRSDFGDRQQHLLTLDVHLTRRIGRLNENRELDGKTFTHDQRLVALRDLHCTIAATDRDVDTVDELETHLLAEVLDAVQELA